MKMKSAVLASALVAVSSVFATSLYDSDVIYTNWFNQVKNSAVEIESIAPVLLNGDTITSNQDGYAVTAQVTVVIHATVPTDAPTNIMISSSSIYPKGSICAAYDNNSVAKWYGLTHESSDYAWTELKLASDETAPFDSPANNAEYTLVTEFDDTGSAHRVRYWVGKQCSKWYTSGHNNALKMVGLDGSGSYTKVVGLLVNAWSATIDSVPISIDKTMLAAMGVNTANTTPNAIKDILNTVQGNGIKAWANYALGISDNVNNTVAATKKPFAAPVQNSDPAELTFKLGGVSARTEVADVKYAIETLTSPTANSSGDLTYKSASETTDIKLDSSEVKYYRVKVQIDAK